MSSPWENVTIGDKTPEVLNAIIEIPKGSRNKYEFDEKLGLFKLDRVMHSSYQYPLDYGFIPQTRSEDGDHLDVLVIGGDPVFVGCVLEFRPVAMLNMIDSGEPDAKILGVQVGDPRFSAIKDLKDLEAYDPHMLKEVTNFFETYKKLQNKEVTTSGWGDAAAAKEEIKKAQEVYKKENH
jgi:inorganic pyrophosphatase